MSSQQLLDQMKNEIAAEMGVILDGNQTSRNCGKVGGEITKRLVRIAEEMLNSKQQ